MYHNFEGSGTIDPRIPGIEKNIRLTTSDNPSVALGAKRAQLYANRIHNDPRFQLLGMNTITDTPLGKTDKDIRFRHSGSGSVGRMEVKDVRPTWQRRDLAHLKGQIDKMAWSQRVTGELQCYVNRRAVIPELKAYAASKGVAVYENVATGEKSRRAAGKTSIDDVLAKEHQRATIVGRTAIIRGGAATGIGILLMGQSSRSAYHELHLLRSPGEGGSPLMLGHHSAMAGSGASMTVAGGASLAPRFITSERALRFLTGTSRVAGPAAVVFFLTAEGFAVSAYWSGDLSNREFWTMQANLGGGLGGGLVAAAGGALLGGAVGGPPGAAIGSIVFSIGGGFGGAWAADYSARRYYEFKDQEHERAFEKFVFDSYGVTVR